jgi:fatty-acyl-CoA synthase
MRTLAEALDAAARSAEGYIFITDGVETRRSYAEIRQASFNVARALRKSGLTRGDLVALVIEDAEHFLTALCGASIAGAIPASLAPPTAATGLSRYFELTGALLRASRARAVVTSAASVARFEAVRASCPDLQLVMACEELQGREPLEPLEPLEPSLDAIAFVQFTSGSTSAPRGVALSHRNLSANIDAINGPTGLGTSPQDSAVSWLPLYHDMGLVGMALGPLYAARPGVLLQPQAFVRRPAEWLKAISRHRATVSFAPNFAYDLAVRRVKDRDLDGMDLSCWRVAGCGAEPISAPTLAAFAERFGAVGFHATSFFPCYGLAEHVLAATMPPRDRTLRIEHVSVDELVTRRQAVVAQAGESAVSLVGCGRALPGHEIRIVDEDGRVVSEREVGEIALSGPSVMLGYYGDDEATGQTIRRGWLYTGDLGFLSDDELFVCGRVKDVIIVNGRKYHPQDLEWAVSDLAGVGRGSVVAFGTAGAGAPDRVVMVVERSQTAAADALVDAIRRRVGDVFGLYVDTVALVPNGSIGRTTSGKVQRTAAKADFTRLIKAAGHRAIVSEH